MRKANQNYLQIAPQKSITGKLMTIK